MVAAPDATPMPHIDGTSCSTMTFGYVPGTPVLRHASFHAEPGPTIALVGPTSASKTTIVNLLTCLYDIESESFRAYGVDTRSVEKHSLRRQLGIVLQKTYLFSATVMANIRCG